MEESQESRVKIAYRIQSVPEREELRALVASLPTETEVIIDDGPLPLNPWRGYQRCLRDLPDCTHVVVLQDDAVVCQNFVPAIERIAKANPNTPVVLFLPGGKVTRTAAKALQKMKRGEHYVSLFVGDFCPAVGILWPRQKAIDLLNWTRTHKLPGPSNPRSDDAIIGYWVEHANEEVLVTMPSLVEHPDETSIVHPKRAKAGADKGRVTLLFCEGDPLEIDWSQASS